MILTAGSVRPATASPSKQASVVNAEKHMVYFRGHLVEAYEPTPLDAGFAVSRFRPGSCRHMVAPGDTLTGPCPLLAPLLCHMPSRAAPEDSVARPRAREQMSPRAIGRRCRIGSVGQLVGEGGDRQEGNGRRLM